MRLETPIGPDFQVRDHLRFSTLSTMNRRVVLKHQTAFFFLILIGELKALLKKITFFFIHSFFCNFFAKCESKCLAESRDGHSWYFGCRVGI